MQSNNIENNNIVAISNPRSGRNKRGGFEKFSHTIAGFPCINHIVTDSENTLISILEKCKNENCQILIVNGGDGTLLQILTYLKKTENSGFNPRLVLLRAGTTSMAYGDVGCKGKLANVLNKVVNYVDGSSSQLNITKRSVLKMTLHEKEQSVCGMFFGGGAIYNGILYCRQNLHTKGVRGELGPSMAMLRYILDWLTVNKLTTTTRASIQLDNDEPIDSEFTIIIATTLRRLLMGVFPFWGQASTNPHIYFSIIKSNAPKPKKAFMKILLGKSPNVELREDYYRSACPTRVTLDIYDGFTLDGELFGDSGQMTTISLEPGGEVTFLTT